jgi:hypothetical protein
MMYRFFVKFSEGFYNTVCFDINPASSTEHVFTVLCWLIASKYNTLVVQECYEFSGNEFLMNKWNEGRGENK